MNNEEKKFNLIKFEDGEVVLDVKISPNEDTLWLTQEQIALLFGKAKSTINEHIRNILKNELDETQVMRKFGKTELSNITTKPIYYYNLDMILAIGYRVVSTKDAHLKIINKIS